VFSTPWYFLSHAALVDWFDVLDDDDNRPIVSEREILRNLQVIVQHADQTLSQRYIPQPLLTIDKHGTAKQVAKSSMGVLSTEIRKIWSSLRSTLSSDKNNASCLQIVDNALFIVCLDNATPNNLADMCSMFLCGTYVMNNGVQVGTCTNRWYDKVGVCVRLSSPGMRTPRSSPSCKSSSVRTARRASTLSIRASTATPS
jgi:carnitine O-acetyltransferase